MVEESGDIVDNGFGKCERRLDGGCVSPSGQGDRDMVQPLIFYDGIRVVNGRDDEDPCEEEEDPVTSGVTILLVGDNPTRTQSEQGHSGEGW